MSAKDLDQFSIRLPFGMRAEIKAAAAANGRSMNNEILHRLGAWTEGSTSSPASQAAVTLSTVKELEAAADRAFAACQRLGIKVGSAS